MVLYVGEVGSEIRAEFGLSLTGAATMQIQGHTPSGVYFEWNAIQYVHPINGPTSDLSYESQEGDLAEAGTYYIQGYVTYDNGWKQRGDLTSITVFPPLSGIPEQAVIDAVEALTMFSVQDSLDEENEENTDASILYNSASRLQGNFSIFFEIAQNKLNGDLSSRGSVATIPQQIHAIALWIGALQERKDPDWIANSVSIADYSFSKDKDKTGYEQAYQAYLDDIIGTEDFTPDSVRTGEPVRPRDSEYYPDAYHLSNMNIPSKQTSYDDPY